MKGLEGIALTIKKSSLDKAISHAQGLGESDEQIVRRIFFYRPSPISEVANDPIFSIFDAVSAKFGVPFKSLCISGSAQTGHSLYKHTDFDPSSSDLDLAIVDAGVFQEYSEASLIATNGYLNNTNFPDRRYCDNVQELFFQGLAKGYFRPDLMPICKKQIEWEEFFRRLTNKYRGNFKSINCAIYFSQIFFEKKLMPVYSKYIERK
ncbi:MULTISPECIES: hypothetical protein [unclassified Janthinobacterium]|uniref:hypothetical protein n=1 Tax=unclassified Janthinobacterium TaxID=2610881 RepID=UPI0025B12496|nr:MULTISPECIES: hypothetical protein [unclassified Janthinobacterium]MDN2713484.1 hypothetical protein [Janthinobacterium sp. SUN120]MDO8065644.1 hypothetical protein [Janthinobacterium sp. SUN206]